MPRFFVFLGLFASCGLTIFTGCGSIDESETPEVVEEIVDPDFYAAPVRFAEVFDDSHLDEIPALLREIPEEITIVDEGFESASPAIWDLERDGFGVPQPRPANGPEFQMRAALISDRDGEGTLLLGTFRGPAVEVPRKVLSIPAKPQTSYRLRVRLRTVDLQATSAGAGVEIGEFSQPFQRKRPEKRAPAIVVHEHLPRRHGTTDGSVEWEYSFRSSENTHQLRIAMTAGLGLVSGRVQFEHMTLVEIPEIAELLRRDAFHSTLRRKDPHPLVKRLSTDRYDFRPAILAPGPTRFRLPVEVDEDTLLRFELGVLDDGSAPMRFRVSWDEKPLISQELTASQDWHDYAVDLSRFAGKAGDLLFETESKEQALGLWGNPRLESRRARPDKPDVVLIVVDTLRADHLGFDGYARPTSPSLDRLAEESMRFPRAFSASPWTAPSMGSILTSRYPLQHQAGLRIDRERYQPRPKRPTGEGPRGWQNRHLGALLERTVRLRYHPLASDETTIAERLRADGYATLGLHSNFNSSGLLGFSRGFDRYHRGGGISPKGAEELTDRAIAWLDGRREHQEEGPFFLMLHTQDPHAPYRMRREYFDEFDPPIDPNRPAPEDSIFRPAMFGPKSWAIEMWATATLTRGVSDQEIEQTIRLYDSEIRHADQALEKLLRRLDERPKTAVFLVADHGEEFADHGGFDHGHHLYNELVRVPLLFRHPDGRGAGEVIDEPVSSLDIGATILELAGLSAPSDPEHRLDGRSLLAYLDAAPAPPREPIFMEAMLRGVDRTAVVEDGFKYIRTHPIGYVMPFGKDGNDPGTRAALHVASEELFDVREDPLDQNDLSTERPDVVRALRERVLHRMETSAQGLHLRCRIAESTTLKIKSGESLSWFKPMTLDVDDVVLVDSLSRREVEVRLQGAGEGETGAWWILRHLAPPKADEQIRVVLEASSDVAFHLGASETPAPRRRVAGVLLGDPALRLGVDQTPMNEAVNVCRVWEVPTATVEDDRPLESAIADQLRDLGYL